MSGTREDIAAVTVLHERLAQLSEQLRHALAAREDPRASSPHSVEELLNAQQTALEELKRVSAQQQHVLQTELAEQRALNDRLTTEQFVFRYVIAHLPHRIWWKDREGRFLGVNDNFAHDLGYERPEEMLGKTDYDMGYTREQADFYTGIDQRVMETGEPLLDIEEPQQRPDGVHTLSTSKVPLRDPENRIVGTVGIFVDLTERKRMEEALREAKEAAEAAARAKGDFLTTVSHELRTPLTLILGPLESLLVTADGELSPEVRRTVERSHRNATRLYTLVNDVLAFARTEAGWMEVQWEAVDVTALVRRVVEDAVPFAKQKHLHLEVSAENDPGIIPLDRAKYEKILLNLVGNAIKFTPEGGHITVGVRADDEQVELSVTDTGPGIPLEKQELIFQRFQQIDSSTTRRFEGTGIGLALVKEFAERMGGSVGVESTPGQGSRFWIRTPRSPDRIATLPRTVLPVAIGDGSRPERYGLAPAVAPRAPAPSAGHRVLIAEDNADMRAYLVDLLSPHYNVEVVENGRLALEAARHHVPDVIVSDVMMPVMDGFELVHLVKSDDALRLTPVILLTAKASREEIVSGFTAGADDYLPKPFGPAELRARIDAAIRMHSLTMELEHEKKALQDTLTELQATQEQLVHAGKMATVGTLVAGLSHELNNPLASILLYTESLLKRVPPNSRERAGLSAIERQARRCAQLVRSLLDVSRKKEVEHRATPVVDLLQRVTSLIGPEAIRRGVDLSSDASEIEGLPIECSVEEMETALLNLVTNALDATPQGGSVSLVVRHALRQQERGVEITIKDTGSGIPADALSRIFEPFFTLKPLGKGTGLGLSLTRKIVESHGGQIRVESAEGEGTRFSIWLPVQRVVENAENESR